MHPTTSTKSGLLRFVLVTTAFALGLIAQLLVANGSFRWAATPYVVAVGVMLLAVAKQPFFSFSISRSDSSETKGDVSTDEAGAEYWGRVRRLEKRLITGGFLVSGLFFILSLRLFSSESSNASAWYLYGASMVLLFLALPGIEGRWTALVRWLRERPGFSISVSTLIQWAILGAILVFALVVRLYDIRDLPAGVWFDEAANLFNANSIQENPGSTPVFSRVIPVFYLLPSAALIKLIGLTHEAIRLVSVAFSVAGVLAIFLLARLMVGPAAGLFAAFFLAAMRWDINFSRIGMVPVTMSLFTALAVFLTLRALKNQRYSDFGFAGAAIGLGLWFYASFQLFPLVIGFILLHHLVLQRPAIKRYAGQLALMVLISAAVAAPLAQFAIIESDEYFSRLSATSTFSIMPLDDAIVQTRTSLRKHIFMLHYRGDMNPRHNLPGEPMLDTLSAFLLVLGLGIAISRWRNGAMASLPVWLLVMLLPGIMTLPFEAPQALRSIGVIPAVVILSVLPLVALWRVGASAPRPLVRRTSFGVLMILLAAIAYLNIDTYFGRQASDPKVYAAFSTDGRLIGEHMLEQQARGYTLLTSRQFKFSLQIDLAGHRPGYDVIRAPTGVPIDAASVGKGASIYIEPREASVYRLLREYYPDGHFEEVRPPGGGEVMYYLALLSREQLEEKRGLVARYTLNDGRVRQSMKMSTEGIWLVEFEPEDVPFDFEWTGTLHIDEPGEYLLSLEGEAQAQVVLDDEPILDDERRSVRIVPAVGLHTLEITGRVEEHASVMRLLWEPPNGAPGPIPANNLYHDTVRPMGLAGRFHAGAVESELEDASRVTPAMDTFWYDPVIPEPYTAVWEGSLDVADVGDHRFSVSGAGDVSLLIDGELVAQRPSREVEASNEVRLGPGMHDIRVEYFSPGPPSEFEILWAPPDKPLEPIPINRLVPAKNRMFRIVSTP